MAAKPNIKILETPQEAASACARFVLDTLAAAIKSGSVATLAISGGSTPKMMFSDFAKASFDWSKLHVFWVDERCVPPTDAQSNFKLANDTWFLPAKFPTANLHRIHGELDVEEGADRYLAEIEQFFQLKPGQIPVFDVIHRGMGADAHTASLVPGEPLINDQTGLVAGLWVEKFHMNRITFLPAVMLAAKTTVLQVSGADKAEPLKSVLEGPENWMQFPCQMGARDSKATWFLDKAAAVQL